MVYKASSLVGVEYVCALGRAMTSASCAPQTKCRNKRTTGELMRGAREVALQQAAFGKGSKSSARHHKMIERPNVDESKRLFERLGQQLVRATCSATPEDGCAKIMAAALCASAALTTSRG